ncbi:MAG: glycoside hydrolase family 2 TIM barrel-domain containing protein [Sedimentisphaerales bacterium]
MKLRNLLKRNNILFAFFWLLCTVPCLGAKTEIVYLSGPGSNDAIDWDFFCTGGRNSGQWTTIPVPSNWELQGFGNYNYGSDRRKSDEKGMYRKNFRIFENWQDRRVFIVFEGVMTDTEVFVNGQSAGPIHQGGFYRFKYEITDLIKPGENTLEVTVSKVSSNRSVEQAERQADYWVFGGLYRPVYLEAVPKQFIEWTAADARADGSFSIDVHLNGVSSANTVRAQITELDGTELGEAFEAEIGPKQEKFTLKTKVKGHKLWTAETPNLYKVQVALLDEGGEVHSVTDRFGFRTFEVKPGDGLYLNGQKIRLKGIDRHSFRPDSGRSLSRDDCYEDARLIKQMNMNAVRMSHYPPDVAFLDACDELGLYVLDELAGWQRPSYDTETGRKLVNEMVTRDASHPSILFWDNANEGGWNRELDGEFALYDPQKRNVLHPWELFGGVDTDHYENYESTLNKLNSGNLFMPTEFLHGLYDGGMGAGLKDYWDAMYSSPMGAGGFLWVFADEGVVRTDRDGQIDVAGNLAPDGILGPYHEKEGSFYAVKEIWSPVHIDMEKLPADFSGELKIENRYDFTNLKSCKFEVKLGQFPTPQKDASQTVISLNKTLISPDIESHSTGNIDLFLPDNWRDSDVLYLTAIDPFGKEIWTWSWNISKNSENFPKYIETSTNKASEAELVETDSEIQVQAGQLFLNFDKTNGQLTNVIIDGKETGFSGPHLIGGQASFANINCSLEGDNIRVNVQYKGDMNYARWTLFPTGWIELDYEIELEGQFDLFGVNFDYPENKMQAMHWLGRGSYRVWKNRMTGGVLGIYSNKYKNNIPGKTWDYPEFKGYYRDWKWVLFETQDSDITIVNGTDDLFLGVYRPNNGEFAVNTMLNIPDSSIAFLHGIPAIGTKFLKPEQLGPRSQKNLASGKYNGTVFLCFGG